MCDLLHFIIYKITFYDGGTARNQKKKRISKCLAQNTPGE